MKEKLGTGSDAKRIRSLLLSDRIGNAEGYTELLTADAADMLSKYIEVDKTAIRVTIRQVFGGRYRIEISAVTDKIKSIGFL